MDVFDTSALLKKIVCAFVEIGVLQDKSFKYTYTRIRVTRLNKLKCVYLVLGFMHFELIFSFQSALL